MLKKEVKKCTVKKAVCENKKGIFIGLGLGIVAGAIAYLLTSED